MSEIVPEQMIKDEIDKGNLFKVTKEYYYQLVDNMISYIEMDTKQLDGYYPPSHDVSLIEKSNLIYILMYEINAENKLRNFDLSNDEDSRMQWDLVNMLRDMDKMDRLKMVRQYLEHFSEEDKFEIWTYIRIKSESIRFGLHRIKDEYDKEGYNIILVSANDGALYRDGF